MKKIFFISVLSALFIALFAANSFASDVSATLDGEIIECVDINGNDVSPILKDGTVYLPVRAISNALNLSIDWDDETKSVFINGSSENTSLSDDINIYISGSKFTAKNANGEVVSPMLKDGTIYLPIRAIGEAFDKNVSWNQESLTAILKTPDFVTDFDEGKTYAIISKASGKAISVSDSALTSSVFESYENQAFRLIPAAVKGYYNISSVYNNKNLDVNGNSKAAGASIITYNASDADNQMFAFVKTDNGTVIYSRSSKLPIEDSADKIKQNVSRDSFVQLWDIVEVEPIAVEEAVIYRTISISGTYLSDSDSLKGEDKKDSFNQRWILSPDSDGEYIITNAETGKSLDVANNSTTSGDVIITYQTSGDPNQRWIFEKNEDGSYLIKSVHSSLYLTLSSDNTIVQSEIGEEQNQNWIVTAVK